MAWGLLTPTDVDVIERSLRRTIAARGDSSAPFRIVEIGVCHGDTSRSLRDVLGDVPFSYLGIDNQRDKPIEPPFQGAQLLLGDSAELFCQLPGLGFGRIDWLLIDGCHCVNHASLDFLHYGSLVRPGGEVCFHDVSGKAQGKGDYQGHGPRELAFGTAVREALSKLGLLPPTRTDWELASMGVDPNVDWGGVAAFRRL